MRLVPEHRPALEPLPDNCGRGIDREPPQVLSKRDVLAADVRVADIAVSGAHRGADAVLRGLGFDAVSRHFAHRGADAVLRGIGVDAAARHLLVNRRRGGSRPDVGVGVLAAVGARVVFIGGGSVVDVRLSEVAPLAARMERPVLERGERVGGFLRMC